MDCPVCRNTYVHTAKPESHLNLQWRANFDVLFSAVWGEAADKEDELSAADEGRWEPEAAAAEAGKAADAEVKRELVASLHRALAVAMGTALAEVARADAALAGQDST